eukprot:TRINITY_DN16738_c0_g1_i1.p1 TRINITY_DN16738_c0_g1~~TRINITY_DN16738_c0_g1_i1.p1  ORF type:complete len:242 (-),score=49.89 TRINITY_DN16738_c0_g1_i1:88-813(-)
MRLVGLTGGIACGKSTVSDRLKHHGAVIIDCDSISRDVVEPGQLAHRLIVAHFGKDILLENGSLNRPKLGEVVFAHPSERRILNNIMRWPIFIAIIRNIFYEMFIARSNVVILDAPLLYETGYLRFLVIGVVVVAVNPEIQLQRLISRNGYSEEEAMNRIRSQMPLEEKVQQADWVLDNSGDLVELEHQVEVLYPKLLKLWPTVTVAVATMASALTAIAATAWLTLQSAALKAKCTFLCCT